MPTPQEHVQTIQHNVDLWYDGKVTYEVFTARQRAAWDAVHAAGKVTLEAVEKLLRAPEHSHERETEGQLEQAREVAVHAILKGNRP
jgi:hypothetical protein